MGFQSHVQVTQGLPDKIPVPDVVMIIIKQERFKEVNNKKWDVGLGSPEQGFVILQPEIPL